MQVDLSLTTLDAQVAATAFDADISGKLHDYLQNEYILDRAGINRVMALLKQTYINGIRTLGAQILFISAHGANQGQPSQEIIDATRAKGQQVCAAIVDNLVNAQTDLLFSMAATLAAQDERIYKRPRH